MTGRVAPGWYPDYEAPPGHQRYWDGVRWTERRSRATEAVPARAGQSASAHSGGYAPWVLTAVAVLVATSAAVLVVGNNGSGPSSASSPPPASTPGPPASEQGSASAAPQPQRRTWEVDTAVDGSTIRLTTGAEVRLAGIADSCGVEELARMVAGQTVTLTRRGPDKDSDGDVVRYVDRDGLDVGKRLIQQGWAKASAQPNARRETYLRVDERSPDSC